MTKFASVSGTFLFPAAESRQGCRVSELLTIRATESDKTCHQKWQHPLRKVRRAVLNETRQSWNGDKRRVFRNFPEPDWLVASMQPG